jgi:hypothetical protein
MLHLYTTYIRRSIYITAVRRVCRTYSPPPRAPAGIKSPHAGRRHGLRVSSAVINFGGLANPRFSHSRKEFRASAVLPAPTAAAALRPKTGSDRPSACQSCDIYDDTTGCQLSSTSNCQISATRAKHFPSNFRTYTAAATTKQLDSRQLLLVRACVRVSIRACARTRTTPPTEVCVRERRFRPAKSGSSAGSVRAAVRATLYKRNFGLGVISVDSSTLKSYHVWTW